MRFRFGAVESRRRHVDHTGKEHVTGSIYQRVGAFSQGMVVLLGAMRIGVPNARDDIWPCAYHMTGYFVL